MASSRRSFPPSDNNPVSRAESTESSGKQKSPFRYLTQNPTKSLCQPSDSTAFIFLDLRSFCSFCAILSDNYVKTHIGSELKSPSHPRRGLKEQTKSSFATAGCSPATSPSRAAEQPQANVRMPRTTATWSRSHPIWPKAHQVN